MSVVLKDFLHTSPTRGMMQMNCTEGCLPKARAIGRQEPSKEAVDRFIEIYLEIVAENERKDKVMLKNNAAKVELCDS